MKIHRVNGPKRPIPERVRDFKEYVFPAAEPVLREQGARCMDCGIPFCHSGCPLGNLIPDWNDLVYRERWPEAIKALHATNNFPEFTGRICPAPCEAACVLDINDDAVTIKQIEQSIIDRAWEEGWVQPRPPALRSGKTVAVIGSGPAGMACSQQLRREGHRVVLFERDEAAGGLIRFGVPDFKIEKRIVERRVQQLRDEGVELRLGVDVGRDVSYEELRERYDAVVLATGSRVPRDLPVPGRDELEGIHFAMDYLYVRNRAVTEADGAPGAITAQGKHVVVIGGGDTGADCVGNSIREGALSVSQLEILPKPPDHRPDDKTPWPLWPMKYRKSYAIEEALEAGKGEQDYAVVTTRFSGNGSVEKLHYARAENFKPVEGTDGEMPAQLVLLAMGFLHPEHEGLVEQAGVELDQRGNVKAPTYEASVPGVFVAGDARRGQSLIVWAINEGRQCARMVDRYLRDTLAAQDPLRTGNVRPADEGPEGPPQHVGPGVGATGS
jgi:glutamate synthase (NADPH) small chain